jgi:orotidine-5'-phosphate decarboxylase
MVDSIPIVVAASSTALPIVAWWISPGGKAVQLQVIAPTFSDKLSVFHSMPTPKIRASERLIVALDLPSIADARKMVQDLEGVVDFFKIGLSLQLAAGVEEFIRSLISDKKRVFLDYKYYDVPETLRKAIFRASELGVYFLTIHGSSALIRAAVESRGNRGLKLFSVTVLTSMDRDDIAEMGYTNQTVEELVLFRARKALEAGCDGVIASGLEVKKIKEMSRNALLVVTPGIRDDDSPQDDQKRRTTARTAVLSGADYLVIGRPVTENSNPRAEAERLVRDMGAAFEEREAGSASNGSVAGEF